MELIRQADWRVMPWRSGQGETAEIAIWPAGENLGQGGFDWRVSVARMSEDAGFSGFPGYDRILTVVEGAGLTLDGGPGAPSLEVPALAPTAFPGERELVGRPKAGPVRNLNLMLARGRARGRARLHESERAGRVLSGAAEAVLIMSLNDAPVVLRERAGATGHRLERLDVLLQCGVCVSDYELTLESEEAQRFMVLEILSAAS